MNRIFCFTILLAMLLTTACTGAIAPMNGQVESVQLGTTLWGMRAAVAEKAGTMIMQRDNLMMFMWSIEDGWAFSIINTTSKSAVKDLTRIVGGPGNFVNPKTMAELADYLMDKGWTIISAYEVPLTIKNALSTSGGWLASMAASMPTLLVLPAGVAGENPVIQMYEGTSG